jgi:acyl-coenzyme A thioesterase PaaI-like protein
MVLVPEFLGGERRDAPGRWRFGFGGHLLGAFGGVTGGALAAAALVAARDIGPELVPTGIDCRFLRPLPAGDAEVVAEVTRRGRTLVAVRATVSGPKGVTTEVDVTLVDALAVHPVDSAAPPPRPAVLDLTPRPWPHPPDRRVAIIETLAPRGVTGEAGIATTIDVPWSDPGAGAEAACLVGDLCVGPPVSSALGDRWVPHPNPDVSLRFVGPVDPASSITAVGRLTGLHAGVAAVAIEVWAGGRPVAVGVSTSLLVRSAR